MKDIDEFYAEKCGVELYTSREINEQGYYWYARESPNIEYGFEWIIQDPRCREIIRERFKIDTEYYEEVWYSSQRLKTPHYDFNNAQGKGKTIAESEINCITAIYEAEKAL